MLVEIPFLECVQVDPTNNCFQVFGLDVLVDNNLHPWILEINANPSFNVYSNDVPAQEPSPDIG